MILKESTYNLLADLARIILPAFATFYLVLADTWHLPYGERVSATIMGVCALLGAFLKTSSKKYFNTGTIVFPNPVLHEGEEDEDAE